MKKLLYTLFAFALIVACDKDNLDNDASSIAPIESSAKDLAIADVKSILNGLDFTGDLQNTPAPKGSSNLTARTAGESTQANCIDNRPDVPAGKTALDIQYLPITSSE